VIKFEKKKKKFIAKIENQLVVYRDFPWDERLNEIIPPKKEER